MSEFFLHTQTESRMLTHVPTEYGSYSVQQYVRYNVWPNKTPFFHVQVNYKRDGVKKMLEGRFYVQDLKDFQEIKALAIAQARDYYREVRKRDDVFFAAELERKQIEHHEKVANKQAALEQRVLRARRDVQEVWARYGPEVEMLKPFYIYQWGG